MPIIKMPDGAVVNFPDNTPRSEILSEIYDAEERVRQFEATKAEEEIERKRNEVGIVGAFGRGLSRGITQTRGLIGDVIPAMVMQEVNPQYSRKQFEEYLGKMQKMEEERPSLVPSITDVDSVSDAAKYGLETLGQFVPSLATSIAGGGIGGFVGTTIAKEGAKKVLRTAGLKAAGKYAQRAQLAGQIGGAFAGSGIQTVPEAYATLYQETGDPKLVASLLVGTFNAALDSIVPAAFLSRLGKQGREELSKNMLARTLQKIGTTQGSTRSRNVLKQGLKSGVIEMLTEGSQQTTQLTAARLLDDNPEFFQSGDFVQILDAAVRGAIGGKAFGAASGAFQKTSLQKDLESTEQSNNELLTAIEIVQDAGGMKPMLQLTFDEDLSNSEKEVSNLKNTKGLPKPIRQILNSTTLSAKEKVQRVKNIQEKLKNTLDQETQTQQNTRKGLEQIGLEQKLIDQIIEQSKIIQLGDETPPLLQLEFDPNAVNSEEELKRVRAQATKDLSLRHPMKKILDSKEISTPNKLKAFKRFIEVEKARLDPKSKFEQDKEAIDEFAGFETTKKDIELTDQRPTEYNVVDLKGKSQNVPPFADIQEAKSYIQEQDKPESFKLQNQLKDDVYTGIATKDLPPTEREVDTKEIFNQRKKIMLGQPVGKRVILSSKEAQKQVLTGQLKESSYYEASERGVDSAEFSDEVEQASGQRLISQEDEIYKRSQAVIENRLEEMANRGDVGKANSDAIREVLDDPSRTVGEIFTAFEVADIMTKILPDKSGHAVKFLESLKSIDAQGKEIAGTEGQVQGLRFYNANLVQLAFKTAKMKDGKVVLEFDRDMLKETASHEAFHILQDFYIKYDPQAKKILDQEFGSTERSEVKVDYVMSKTAKWMKRTNKQLHEELLAMDRKQGGITGRELQAYAFSAYNRARLEGRTPVMAGGLSRYFRFVTQFIERLSNSFKGYGFQNAQDVFEAVSGGVASKSFNNRALNERAGDSTDLEASSRAPQDDLLTGPNGERYRTDARRRDTLLKINNGSTTIAKIQLRKNEAKKNIVFPQGERYYSKREQRFQGYGADIIMHPSNVNLIKLNTPHERVVSFIQDVVTNGKIERDGDGNLTMRYKNPSYKQIGVVRLQEDKDNPSNVKVMHAYSRDDKKLQQQRNAQLKKEAERLRARQAPDEASQEDIDAFRRQGQTEASERGVRAIRPVRQSDGGYVYKDFYIKQITREEGGGGQWNFGRFNPVSNPDNEPEAVIFDDAANTLRDAVYMIDNTYPEFETSERGIQGASDRISPALATSVKTTAYRNGEKITGYEKPDPLAEQRSQIDLQTIIDSPYNTLKDGTLIERMSSIFKKFRKDERSGGYPLLTEKETRLPDIDFIDTLIERMSDNLLFIYNSIPEVIRNRSKLWYKGANRIAREVNPNYGISTRQAAGIFASLSPQKDWYQNVSLGQRLMDIMATQRDHVTDTNMQNWIDSYLENIRLKAFDKKDGSPKKIREYNIAKSEFDQLKGKSLSQLSSSYLKSLYVRTYDEAYNDKAYKIVSPEGDFLEVAKNQDGSNSDIAWGSFKEIAAAVSIFENGSLQNISDSLSNKHKVRSFYNNIISPDSVGRDVTSDTHAVAANLLLPLGGKALQVGHNFGVLDSQWKAKDGYEGMPSSKFSGVMGSYGIHAEAYRRASEKVGVLPREMQSITWEAVRSLFPDTFKTESNLAKIASIWNKYDGTNLAEIQNEIVEAAGGFKRPSWAGGEYERLDYRTYETKQDTDQQGKLSGKSVSRGRRDDTRVGIGTTRRGDVGEIGRGEVESSARGPNVTLVRDDINDVYQSLKVERRDLKRKRILDGLNPVEEAREQQVLRELNDIKTDFKRRISNARTQGIKEEVDTSYRIDHQPRGPQDETPVRLDDLTISTTGEPAGYPSDFYSTEGQRIYAPGARNFNDQYGKANKESYKAILEARGNPDGEVTIYRAVPNKDSIDSINFGDFVTLSKTYAELHGESGYGRDGNEKGKVLAEKVPVKDVFWAQDDVNEFGYFPPNPYIPYIEESRRGISQSFGQAVTSNNDSTINNFLSGFKRLYSLGDNFVNEFINSTEPIGKYEEEVNLSEKGIRKRMNVAEGAQRYMEMVMNRAGRVEMIMKYGAPIMRKDGGITFSDKKGLFQIFEGFDIKEYQQWEQYAKARRAKALADKEKFITQSEIQRGLALETDKFKKAFKEYQDFNTALLDFMVQAGMLDQKQRNNLAKYDYIPFYRVIEEDTYRGGILFKSDVRGPNTTAVFNNPQKYIMEYSGGTKPIGDLAENMFRNAQALVDTAMKNKAMEKAINLMERAGLGKRVNSSEAAFLKSAQGGGKVVSFNKNVLLKNGNVVNRKVHYDISEDPHVYASLASMTPRQTDGLFKVMERMGRIFREGITHAPPFMIANLIRGDMAAFVTVDAPLTPMTDTLVGLKNAYQESETVREMKLISGVGGYNFGDDFRDSANALKRQMRQRHRGYNIVADAQGVTDLLKAGWGQLTQAGEATELATREAIYRKLVDQGMAKEDAAYEALNVINFNRKGAAQTKVGVFVNSLLPLVPFLNARFQGLYRTFEPMTTGKQADRGATIGKGLLLMGANLALYSLMSQDDRWREEPLHRKLAYHIIYPNVIGLEDVLGTEPILIPRAFEIGAIFTSIPELFLDGISTEGGEYVADGLLHTFINTFSFNPLPQAMIPAIEVASNYDFFTGRNVDSASQQRYLKSERVGPTTPEAARLLSKASQDTFSPNQISQLVEGYLGTLGGYALTAFDVIASGTGVIPTRPTGVFGDSVLGQTAEALGFGRFRKSDPDPSNRFISDFYELKKEVETIYSTVNMLKRDGRRDQAFDLMDKHKNKLRFRKNLLNINEKLKKLNKKIRMVRLDGKLTANEKQSRLNGLIKQRNNSARLVDKILTSIRES